MAHPKLVGIKGTENDNRRGDVIFMHGLGGDALETWYEESVGEEALRKAKRAELHPEELDFWPAWLGKTFPYFGIWSLDYDIEPSAWRGATMPLSDRANNILQVLSNKRIGKRPIVFIAHSMGGLLVKQMLRNAFDFDNVRWKGIVDNTRGIVFIATPHSGASLSNWMQFLNKTLQGALRLSISVEELEHNHSRLRELNNVYRNHACLSKIPLQAYFETQSCKPVGIVVDQSSADPGMQGVVPLGIDADHISICKIHPDNKEDSIIYNSTVDFLEDNLIHHPL